ncbi:hypothetical protein V1522DRAFT_149330 [Lipomyces starkeyi]
MHSNYVQVRRRQHQLLMLTMATTVLAILCNTFAREDVQEILAMTSSQQLGRPYHLPIPYATVAFDLDRLDDNRIQYESKFSKAEIYEILPHLKLHEIQWSHRCKPEPLTALCIVLRRLAYPVTYGDLANMFGMSPSWLCLVFRDVVDHVVHR